MRVEDRWYDAWGVGVVVEVTKRHIVVRFQNPPDSDQRNGLAYDRPHAREFLRIAAVASKARGRKAGKRDKGGKRG
jgi:hypothetical protein